ncbi:MAG: DMT family transporter [Tateyamaria sp.]|jgi:drug/metabolite transporter (DMT)-like permease|nr:DMT family transporter [Tateyamaria sp.]MBT5300680.1 DMT family transporter [Tateyamaria sp.]MBT6266726.1 DMT family transporter [Tateyamaria sp.]MBT7446761.1 DMT family transporter [Tateyamaria sp.]MBT7801692.1 DMT family transporter [Tateyamaria sp.]
MNRKTHIDMFGVVALIAIALNFGLNQIVIKFSNGGFQPLFMACLRSAGAGIVLLIWMRINKIPFFLPRSSLIFGALAGVFFALEFSLLFTALDLTTVSRSSIIFYSMPVWLALILHFAVPDEKLSVLRFIGLLLAMLGVFIALFDRQDEQGNLLGDILSLFAALCWAAIALLVRITPLSKISAEQQLLCQLVVSAPILLIMSLGYGTLLRDVEFIHVIGLAYQIFAIASFGFLSWFWLMKRYPVSLVASFSFLSPVFAVLLGWIILDEQIEVTIWLALGLVAAGLYLINRR